MSHLPLASLPRSEIQYAVEDVLQEAQSSRRVLLSCEAWTSLPPAGHGADLVRQIVARVGRRRTHLVCYFRNPVQFVESSYAQWLWGGVFGIDVGEFARRGPGLDSFLDAFEEKKGYPLYSLKGHAEALARHYPNSRLHLRSLHREDLGGRDVTEDLAKLLGVPDGEAVGSKNIRRPTKATLAFQHARGFLGRNEFTRVRSEILGLPFDEHDGKNATLHVGAELRERIMECVEAEKNDLARMFRTSIDALTRDVWRAWSETVDLSPSETAMVDRLCAQAKAKQSA